MLLTGPRPLRGFFLEPKLLVSVYRLSRLLGPPPYDFPGPYSDRHFVTATVSIGLDAGYQLVWGHFYFAVVGGLAVGYCHNCSLDGFASGLITEYNEVRINRLALDVNLNLFSDWNRLVEALSGADQRPIPKPSTGREERPITNGVVLIRVGNIAAIGGRLVAQEGAESETSSTVSRRQCSCAEWFLLCPLWSPCRHPRMRRRRTCSQSRSLGASMYRHRRSCEK
jgi:hypothetical protein